MNDSGASTDPIKTPFKIVGVSVNTILMVAAVGVSAAVGYYFGNRSGEDSKDKPVVKITAPEGRPLPSWAPYGVTVAFTINNDESDITNKQGKFAVGWTVEVPDALKPFVEYSADNSTVRVPSGDATFGLKAIAVTATAARGNTIAVDRKVVAVGGAGPKPDDSKPDDSKPDDKPDAPPQFPDGKFKLAAQAYKWTASVTDPRIDLSAKDLANSFLENAKAIREGSLKDALNETILAAIKSSNQKALGDRKTYWFAWFAELNTALEKHFNDGSLRTPEDFATAWTEIATGLNAVKAQK